MEYFAFDLHDGTVALVPFPADLSLDGRAAYMLNPPADVVADARRMPAHLYGLAPAPDAAPIADTPAPDAAPDAAPDDAPAADVPELED